MKCERCPWEDPDESGGDDSASRLVRFVLHTREAHVAEILAEARRKLREAKRRWGLPMDAGTES